MTSPLRWTNIDMYGTRRKVAKLQKPCLLIALHGFSAALTMLVDAQGVDTRTHGMLNHGALFFATFVDTTIRSAFYVLIHTFPIWGE